MRPLGFAALAVFWVCQKIASRPFTRVKTNWERASRGRSPSRSIVPPRRRQSNTGVFSTISIPSDHSSS
jgi:hypothetical protein